MDIPSFKVCKKDIRVKCLESIFILPWKSHWFKQNLNQSMTKPTEWHVRQSKTQLSLGIRLICFNSLRCALDGWLLNADSEDSDQLFGQLFWVLKTAQLSFFNVLVKTMNVKVMRMDI